MSLKNLQFSAIIFDLDGVLVDTAHFHYLSWKRLAAAWSYDFTETQNEALKGVSRQESLERLLAYAGKTMTEDQKITAMKLKNDWYLELVQTLKPTDLLPGVAPFLDALRQLKIKIALGSASKNAKLILDKCNISHYFDVISDGNNVKHAKPDPEVFIYAAEKMGLKPAQCVVMEDSQAGLDAAINGGFVAVALGSPNFLKNYHLLFSHLGAKEAGEILNEINNFLTNKQ